MITNAKYSLSKKLGRNRYSIFDDCIEALRNSEFTVEYADYDKGYIGAYTGFSWKSFGEHITINIDWDGTVHMKSTCATFQLIDWGKNKNNIDEFLNNFNRLVGLDQFV